jgi:hypothetical protein
VLIHYLAYVAAVVNKLKAKISIEVVTSGIALPGLTLKVRI